MKSSQFTTAYYRSIPRLSPNTPRKLYRRMPAPKISVVISTRNRRDEVTMAIRSCLEQTLSCEIVVIDDASTDGTSGWIRLHFPQVKLITREKPCDSCANRNEGFRIAQGQLVISLDDDSFFSSPDTLKQIVDKFDMYPEAAILSLAYVEPRQDGVRSMAYRPASGTPMKGFVACAAAFRMAFMREIGAYHEAIRRQGEERDLAIRVWDKSKSILYADTPPVIHLYSPKRNQSQMNYLGYRNNILFCWMRIPFPECILKAVTTTIQLILYKFTFRELGHKLSSLGAGWLGALMYWNERGAVSRSSYRQYKSLLGHGPIPMSHAEQSRYLSLIEERIGEVNRMNELH